MTFISFLTICIAVIYAICYLIVSIKAKETLRFKGYAPNEITRIIIKESFEYTIVAVIIFLLFGELTMKFNEMNYNVEQAQYIIPDSAN